MANLRQKSIYAILGIGLLIFMASSVRANDATTDTDTLDIGAMIQPIGPDNMLGDKTWYWWGAGVVRGDDGKYHLFCSRWPRKYNFPSWLTHSEVAHAVSDNPAGPYRYVETAITCRGGGWDQVTAHNPKIKKFGSKYYIYYIGTHIDRTEPQLIEIARLGGKSSDWSTLRNNQRTGVAISDSLSGPWTRSENPVIEPAGPIVHVTVNPGVCMGPDGRYYMIIKGDKPGSRQRDQAIAIAPDPAGPWEIQPRPAIADYDTEDASIWYDRTRQRFYAVYHAHTHIGMITSVDGLTWQKARHWMITKKHLAQTDGTFMEPARLERPFVLLDENDQPIVLFCSVRLNNGDSANIHIPLKQP